MKGASMILTSLDFEPIVIDMEMIDGFIRKGYVTEIKTVMGDKFLVLESPTDIASLACREGGKNDRLRKG